MVGDDNTLIQDDETLDDLIINDMKIIQPRQGYRFSLDAVLLAHFPDLNKVNYIVDLGTGNGVIPLLLAQRTTARITGVEIQENMVQRACRSIKLNSLEAQIEIINADIKKIDDYLPGGCADLVLSNPPFWRKGEGRVSKNSEEATARHELSLNLGELIERAQYLLRPGGRLVIIQRADRLQEIMQLFTANKLAAKRLRIIHALDYKEAKLVLLEGEKNSRSGLTILPPLIIYREPGQYTEELISIYYGGKDEDKNG